MNAVMVQPVKIAKMRSIQAAFSLIELAIVITIIGLLIGGVLATSSFLTAAKNKTLINEGKMYINAFKQFEQKYGGGKPGDLGNATSYWPVSAACPTTGAAGTTCNGNGDGFVGYLSATPAPAEHFYVFRHLSLAGMIPGSYTGNSTGSVTTIYATIGTNIPALSVEGVGGYFLSPSTDGYASSAAYFQGFYGTPFFIGGSSTNSLPYNSFLTASTMQEIDNKFDDGRASTGWIRPFMNYTNCVTGADSDYFVSSKELGCTIILLNP